MDAPLNAHGGGTRAAGLFDLTGKIALVTGSSRGIGLAIAEALAGAGAHVVLNAREPARLADAERRLRASDLTVDTRCCDITDPTAVAEMVDDIERRLGAIGILVNNAGMQFRAPLEEFPLDKWRELFRLNVESAFLVAQAVARHMIPRRSGKIVNVCSVQAELGRRSIAPYAATKGALKMLTKGMCADWAQHGIQVNAIGPGYFRTDLNRPLVEDVQFSAWLEGRTPARRWGELSELAGAAIFLAGPASSFVNGHVLYVDGGITASL